MTFLEKMKMEIAAADEAAARKGREAHIARARAGRINLDLVQDELLNEMRAGEALTQLERDIALGRIGPDRAIRRLRRGR